MSQANKLYKFILIICLGVFTTSFAQAQSKDIVNSAPALDVQMPDSFRGAYLSVCYVIAIPPGISTNFRQYHVLSIKQVVTVPITGRSVHVPAASLPVVGFYQGFNFVLLIVHQTPKFTWVNESNGSIPDDPRGLTPDPTASTPISLVVKKKWELKDLAITQGHPGLAVLWFNGGA